MISDGEKKDHTLLGYGSIHIYSRVEPNAPLLAGLRQTQRTPSDEKSSFICGRRKYRIPHTHYAAHKTKLTKAVKEDFIKQGKRHLCVFLLCDGKFASTNLGDAIV